VGSSVEVPGHCAAVGSRRGILRSGSEVSRARQHTVHPVLPRRYPPVPVPSCALEGGGMYAAAASLLHLRKQGGRPASERDALDGTIAAVAGGAREVDRVEADGRDRGTRLLRTAFGVARRAGERTDGGMVNS